MKRTLSIILVAILMISALTSLIVVPASAAGEGQWDVVLPAPVMEKAEDERQPAQGYYYDATGFHSVSPNYTNYTPHFTVISKEMYNIQNFSMTVEVADYCVEGDNWLSFSVWSESNGLAQGVTSGKYGDGWTSLIRPDADGNLNRLESWDMRKGGRSGKQSFINIDATQAVPVVFPPRVDAETGVMSFTFAIKDGVVSINGVVIGANTDAVIADRFKEGLAYVGVTLNNSGSSKGDYNPTISVVDVNGSVPTGSDSRDPESKTREYGPMIDSSTVAENTPAVWFDGTLEKTNIKLPSTSNCSVDFSDDNSSILVTADAAAGTIQFFVPDPITYEANDFPYLMFVLKNYCVCDLGEDESALDGCLGVESAAIWYCAGDVSSPRNDCMTYVDLFVWTTPLEDSDLDPEAYYTVAIVDLSALNWEGRINNVRFDFAGFKNFSLEGRNTFEIIGAGAFASDMGAANYLTTLGLDKEMVVDMLPGACEHFDFNEDGICDICEAEITDDPVEDTTEESTEIVTEDPTNNGSEATSENVSEVVSENVSAEVPSENESAEAPSETDEVTTAAKDEVTTAAKEEVTTAAPDASADKDAKKGCGSSVAMSALAIVAIVGAGAVSLKKKEN